MNVATVLAGEQVVLDADRARLAAEDSLIQAHTEAATSLIAVFKALGGGWDGPPAE